MEICKLFAVVFLSIVLYSIQAAAQGGDSEVTRCMQKLMPCQPYIHKVNPRPPPSCCGPLKEIVEKDPPSMFKKKKKKKKKGAPCLCTLFSNPEVLQKLNLTKENALDLPKACGFQPDVSKCPKTASSPPRPPASLTTLRSSSGGSSVQAVDFIGLVFASAFVARILF